MLRNKFNTIVKAIKEHEHDKAEKLIMENIDNMNKKQRKKIVKEVKKHYGRM